MKFFKISATENTFFYIDEKELVEKGPKLSINSSDRKKLARLICSNYGSGADGLVIVKSIKNELWDFEWDFYNKDGSSAEMCGNASRGMALFVRDYLGFTNKELKFNTIAGPILVKYFDSNFFCVKMPRHQINTLWKNEKVFEQNLSYSFINTGVPHAVIEVLNLKTSELLPIVKHFRFKEEFGKTGANVSFFSVKEGHFEGITFERGVEGFTRSCGTGVVSIALSIFNNPKFNFKEDHKKVEITTPGGELMVELKNSDNYCWLTGPAQLTEVVECLPK